MLDSSKRITKPVLIFASKHQSRLIKQEILNAFDGLIGRYVSMFHRKYPEIEREDLEQIARERSLICIQKWTPEGDSFSFPKYLKQALFFGLRRYCHQELRHLKCMPIDRDAPLVLKEEKIRLNLDQRTTMRDNKNFQEETYKENSHDYNSYLASSETIEEYRLEMNTQSIGYKVSKFMKKLLSDGR